MGNAVELAIEILRRSDVVLVAYRGDVGMCGHAVPESRLRATQGASPRLAIVMERLRLLPGDDDQSLAIVLNHESTVRMLLRHRARRNARRVAPAHGASCAWSAARC